MTASHCRITIGGKIKKYRADNKLSQSGFGRLVGVSAQAVSKWENGICFPDLIFLPSLARLLGCMVDDFFEEDESADR